MSKVKKVFEWIISIFIVIVFIISAFALVGAINGSKTGVNSVFGMVYYSIQSDSMEDEFYEGDMIIGKLYDGETVLEKDQIITFKQRVGDSIIFNTHRIVDIKEAAGSYFYETKGDNEIANDRELKAASDVIAVYQFRIPYVGHFVDWLKEPAGFIVCVILPIVAVILYEAYKIVSLLLKTRDEKIVAETAEATSEDLKAEIIRQYLAEQEAKAAEQSADEAKAEEAKVDEAKVDEAKAEEATESAEDAPTAKAEEADAECENENVSEPAGAMADEGTTPEE